MKKNVWIALVIAFVLILLTVGIVLLSNVKQEDKSSNQDKVSAVSKVEKEEKGKKEKRR